MTPPKKYKVFSFDSYEINLPKNRITFHYSVDGEIFFDPILELDLSNIKIADKIAAAAFNLGMAEIPSFYKTVCTPKIQIKAGPLSPEQIKFWEELYINGLGEFFFRNKIDFRDLCKIEVNQNQKLLGIGVLQGGMPLRRQTDSIARRKPNTQEPYGDIRRQGFGADDAAKNNPKKFLVPIGGGKDSIVTAEILKEKNLDFTWFMLEPWPVCQRVIDLSGNSKKIEIRRDPEKYFSKVIELNKQGFYNGHVPISAVYIFSAVLAAQIHGFTHIVLSNERSANIGNTAYLGREINHQYSKSWQFESSCHDYIQKYISPQIYFFSLLRNLFEIQITEKFCKYPKYFNSFLSCNKGLKMDSGWCGKCAKCVFVFTMLSAFLEPREIAKIFGGPKGKPKNLFAEKALLPIFEELLGLKNIKPWDCVGTPEEVYLALYLAKKRIESTPLGMASIKSASRKLPSILAKLDVEKGQEYQDLFTADTNEHLIPKDF